MGKEKFIIMFEDYLSDASDSNNFLENKFREKTNWKLLIANESIIFVELKRRSMDSELLYNWKLW